MRRTVAIVVAIGALAGAGCGDPLSGVGDLSRAVVHGDTTSTTTTEAPAGPAADLKAVTESVAWINDGLDAGVDDLERDDLIRAVWRRGGEASEFVQAGRAEIAAALPGIRFPRLVPGSIVAVSSQLVFDAQTGTLDVATAAAFGLWAAEPYSVPRSEGQVGVLQVGFRTPDSTTREGEIQSFRLSTGRELVWVEGDYVYQLFCRTGVTEATCFATAESTSLLSLLVPVSVLPGG